MATINELQDEVVEEFQDFTDWMDKYQMLIDLGNELAPLEEKYKNEQNLIDRGHSAYSKRKLRVTPAGAMSAF